MAQARQTKTANKGERRARRVVTRPLSQDEFRETLLREAEESGRKNINAVRGKIRRAIREGLKAAGKTR